MMIPWIRRQIAKNLRLPQRGLFGYYISRVFQKRNSFLERNAVELCNIQPHHQVLEVGFGPGIGLEEAYRYIKDGPGKVHGVDLSEYMVSMATGRLQQQIDEGKVVLRMASVDNLPYNTDTFDAVYHCNSYYFWPGPRESIRELYRVMKPGATMVTTLNLNRIKKIAKQGLITNRSYDPLRFMMCLEQYGFENVKFRYLTVRGQTFEAIFAEITQKPVYFDLDKIETDASESKDCDTPEKTVDLKVNEKV
ncbi:uncharacterized protein LOC121387871 isoform X2 [Gigantopelta aegis]|uniref:uncharacterized protein LOC121387871 isoform X2 n=1 Tax=Gigantopelta aegis TaxID=1735272 RepID=UPI001B889448|nr:uncharacterized protein LOC121387871 isoform X2 [Gigantopelta aegis]